MSGQASRLGGKRRLAKFEARRCNARIRRGTARKANRESCADKGGRGISERVCVRRSNIQLWRSQRSNVPLKHGHGADDFIDSPIQRTTFVVAMIRVGFVLVVGSGQRHVCGGVRACRCFEVCANTRGGRAFRPPRSVQSVLHIAVMLHKMLRPNH